MEWEDFLNHPEVKNANYFMPPDQYLLGKILHDVLECLNGFNLLHSRVAPKLQNVDDSIINWLADWSLIFEDWVKQITPFWNYYKKYDSSFRENIPGLIGEIEQILKEVTPHFVEKVKEFGLPSNVQSNYWLVESGIHNIERLLIILQAIRNKEYFQLWKTERYE